MAVANPFDQFSNEEGPFSYETGFYWGGGLVALGENAWYIARRVGVTAFETDEGLVVVDSGSEPLGPYLASKLREVSSAPVHTAVYTHGHRDHANGLAAFLAEGQDSPRVFSHPLAIDRFDRYALTAGYNRVVRNRQVGGMPDSSMSNETIFGRPAVMPTEFVTETQTIVVGGQTFVIEVARGETDDALWVWNPDREVLCTGDLVIWATPNAGNPQKVQRYPWEWATALRTMAALNPRTLCPGHGGPIVDDPETVQRLLIETAEFLETIVEQTLAALNDGGPPHVDIVHRIDLPTSDSPWLRPVYDEAEFIVRNVIRYYGGWWSGRPSELKPAPRHEVASVVAELAGGVDDVLARAEKASAAGDHRVASHLADWALEAAPSDTSVQERVIALYEARAAQETSMMAVNLFRSAAEYARAGRAFA